MVVGGRVVLTYLEVTFDFVLSPKSQGFRFSQSIPVSLNSSDKLLALDISAAVYTKENDHISYSHFQFIPALLYSKSNLGDYCALPLGILLTCLFVFS